uniref:Uncharacterized protein n=1 Tax=Aegilops tauschii TaxID=37682 RepID=M8C252_AEGTA
MAASLLLRRRELASPLGTLAASVQSTYAANVCSRWRGSGRTLSAKATQNEVTGTDLGTDKSCGVMEGKGGQTDYTDEMWTKDREEIKHMKAEYEEHMRTCRKQMDALFERERTPTIYIVFPRGKSTEEEREREWCGGPVRYRCIGLRLWSRPVSLSQTARCVDKKLARLKKKLDRIERVCNVMTFILIPIQEPEKEQILVHIPKLPAAVS